MMGKEGGATDAEPFFWPWVGPTYADSGRLLVLGESHYSTRDKDDRALTRRVVKAYVDGQWKHRFWTLLARTIEGAQLPAESCRALWSRVAFYNYIQVAMPQPRWRPTDAQWQAARQPFLQVLEQLQPARVLVVGRELWSRLLPAPEVAFARQNGETWPARRYDVGAKGALATFIHHPASPGYNWRRWADVVAALKAEGERR